VLSKIVVAVAQKECSIVADRAVRDLLLLHRLMKLKEEYTTVPGMASRRLRFREVGKLAGRAASRRFVMLGGE
jgi:hypothetical protein